MTQGVVLAGGRSRRFGSPKTLATIDGEPLIWRPLRSLLEATGSAAVVCKADTPLPELPDGVEVWRDEEPGHHPAAGIAAALRRAGVRRIAVLGADMPGADATLVQTLLDAGEGNVVASTGDGLQPLAACYLASAHAAFAVGVAEGLALRAVAKGLDPVVVEVDAASVASVNRPEDIPAG